MVAMLLVTTFVISFAVATIVVVIFTKPNDRILKRVVPVEISQAWTRYLQFAIYVVGIGGGVRVWSFEKYLTAVEPYREVIQLTRDRWMLEIYETIIGTLQSTTAVLLAFFIFALIAVVIVRAFEFRATKVESPG
jgi:hypothetical protein